MNKYKTNKRKLLQTKRKNCKIIIVRKIKINKSKKSNV